MKGKLLIDGIDIFEKYGIFITENAYANLVQYPPLKQVNCNDWPDEDGIEADLSAPKLDIKEFPVAFCGRDKNSTLEFFQLLKRNSYHIFQFNELGCSRKLRLISNPQKQVTTSIDKFSLLFADDFPLYEYTYQEPIPDTKIWQRGYDIDGIPLSSYGIWVLEGTANEVLKFPEIKKNLYVNINTENGAHYDDNKVYYKSKDVNVKCFIHSKNTSEFWRNYNAFLYDLVRPGQRIFYADCSLNEYPCYYVNAKVTKLNICNSRIWCEFTITLKFTSFNNALIDKYLAAEDGRYIVTEDNFKITFVEF